MTWRVDVRYPDGHGWWTNDAQRWLNSYESAVIVAVRIRMTGLNIIEVRIVEDQSV